MQRKKNQAIPCKFVILLVIAMAILAAFSAQTNFTSAATTKPERIYDAMADHQVWDSITINNNIAYVGTVDGLVYALNLATGQLQWGPISTGDEFNGAPTVSNGVVYLAGTHGHIYAFNAAQTNGQQELWSITVTSALFGTERFYNSPTASGGLLFIAGMNGGFYVYADGTNRPTAPIWSYQTDEGTGGSHVAYQFESPVVVLNGVAYAASLNGWVCAFNASATPQTAPLWHFKLDGSFVDSPTVANEIIYLASINGNIYSFPASSSSPVDRFLWNRTVTEIFESSPVVYGDVAYYAGGNGGILYAYNANSGRALWNYVVGGHFYGSPVAANGVVYVENVNGSIYAFAAGTTKPSSPLWSADKTGDAFYGTPIMDNNILYAIGEQGIIYAYADNVAVTFSVTGLVAGTDWNVTFDGVTRSSVNQTVSFSVFPNGVHSYSVCLPNHYVNKTPLTGTVTVLGQNAAVPVSFSGDVTSIKIASNNTNVVAGVNQTILVVGYDYFGNLVGPVAADLSISNSSGGSASGNKVSATVVGIWNITATYQGITSAPATLTVAPAALNRIVVNSINSSLVAGNSQAFTVKGYDVYGNSVNATNVTFSIPPSAGGSVSDNVVSATKAGAWTVTASCPGIPKATTTINVTAGPLNHLSVSMPQNFTAGSQIVPSVEGFDVYNNTLGAVAANFTLPSAANGFVNGNKITATVAGSWMLTASLPGINSASAAFSVTPDVVSRITIAASSSSITAGGNKLYAATGYDRYNNSVGLIPAQFTIASGAGGNINGSQVSATIAGVWNVTAAYNGVSASTSLSVDPGALDHISISTQTGSIIAGTSSTFSAQGFDAYNNSVGTVPATFSISPDAGGSVNGNQVLATKMGQWPVTASYPGVKNATTPLTVTPGDLDYIKINSPPGSITAGDTQTFTAEGYDHHGNDLGPVDAAFSVSPNAAGKVEGSKVSATKAGTWTVTASKDGVNAMAPLQVTPGPATKFTVTKNPVASVNNGAHTYLVTAQDAYGNTATGYTGTVWLGSDDSDTYFPNSVNLVNGVAAFNVTSTQDAPSIVASTTELPPPPETPAPTEMPANPTANPTDATTQSVVYSSFGWLAPIVASVIVIVFVTVAVKRKKVKLPKKLLDLVSRKKGQMG